MKFSKRLNELRKKKGLTQEELAKRLFVTNKTISSWEADRTEPGLEMIVELTKILECSIGYLVYGNNSKDNIETEIKIKLSELEYNKLDVFMQNNAEFLNDSRQVDTYCQPTYRKFLVNGEVNEWLRIGERGNKSILNYKNWHNNMYCDEYEVEVDNSENLRKIFTVLGLEEIVAVDKRRKTYMYGNKYEISLDHVKKLGYFVEIEVKKYSKGPVDEYADLLLLAKDFGLNLDNIDKRGHPYRLIFENDKKKQQLIAL